MAIIVKESSVCYCFFSLLEVLYRCLVISISHNCIVVVFFAKILELGNKELIFAFALEMLPANDVGDHCPSSQGDT